MKIDRRPIFFQVIANSNYNSTTKPYLNPWGYSETFRKTGVSGFVNTLDGAIAAGYRRLCTAKLIGQKQGDDIPAASYGMYTGYIPEWRNIYVPWLNARKQQYPDLECGFYVGSSFEEFTSINCNQLSPSLKISVDTSSPSGLAYYHGCYDFLINDLKADFIGLDKGSITSRIDKIIQTDAKMPTKFISEAVMSAKATQIPMLARTQFWYTSKDVSPSSVFDPSTTEIHWLLEQDYGVPASGQPLQNYVNQIVSQGIIPMGKGMFAAAEIMEATKPKTKTWWHLNKVRT